MSKQFDCAIRSMPNNENYDANYDRIFRKKPGKEDCFFRKGDHEKNQKEKATEKEGKEDGKTRRA